MPKVLILTLGFDEKFCYRAILRHDIKESDRILIFTGKIIDKTKNAYKMIKEFLHKSYGEKIKVDLIELDSSNLIGSMRRVIATLNSLPEDKWIINLSGGMRFVILTVILSVLMHSNRNIVVEMETEDLSSLIIVPPTIFVLIEEKLTDERYEVLKIISEGFSDVKRISSKLKRKRSTIRKHIQALLKMGLIEAKRRKPLIVEINEIGKLALDLYGFR